MRNGRRYGPDARAHLADPARQQRLRDAKQIYDPMVRGKLVHRAVQLTALRGDWSYSGIRAVAAEVEPEGLPPIYKMSIRTVLVTAVGSYRNNFRRANWKLVGYEIAAGPLWLDLLWRTPDGLVADELKMGEGYAAGAPAEDLAQVRGQCTHAARTWGDEFLGVRLLPLLTPDQQRWVAAQ